MRFWLRGQEVGLVLVLMVFFSFSFSLSRSTERVGVKGHGADEERGAAVVGCGCWNQSLTENDGAWNDFLLRCAT